jgi:hypothetical protein
MGKQCLFPCQSVPDQAFKEWMLLFTEGKNVKFILTEIVGKIPRLKAPKQNF